MRPIYRLIKKKQKKKTGLIYENYAFNWISGDVKSYKLEKFENLIIEKHNESFRDE